MFCHIASVRGKLVSINNIYLLCKKNKLTGMEFIEWNTLVLSLSPRSSSIIVELIIYASCPKSVFYTWIFSTYVGLLENGFPSKSNRIVVLFRIGIFEVCPKCLNNISEGVSRNYCSFFMYFFPYQHLQKYKTILQPKK